MKTSLKLLILTGLICAGLFTATAAEKTKATPGGGRLLDKTSPHAEVVIAADRTVTINFYDADMKPVAATTQSVTLIANAKEKVTIEFEKKGDVLMSKSPLPEGKDYNVVVQFKQTAGDKPQNFRFKYDLHLCSGCKRAEYGCTCGH